jgi:hypothetical protein
MKTKSTKKAHACNLKLLNEYIITHRAVKHLQAKRKPLLKYHLIKDNELYIFYSFLIDKLIDKELNLYVRLKMCQALN